MLGTKRTEEISSESSSLQTHILGVAGPCPTTHGGCVSCSGARAEKCSKKERQRPKRYTHVPCLPKSVLRE